MTEHHIYRIVLRFCCYNIRVKEIKLWRCMINSLRADCQSLGSFTEFETSSESFTLYTNGNPASNMTWEVYAITYNGTSPKKTLISSKADLSNTAKHPVFGGDVVGADVDRIYAGWANATTVYLYIHTNGNTEDHTKLVKYYDVPTNGFDLTTIKLADIFPNYGKYDDSGDEKYGWFTEAQWKNYCLGRHVYDSTDYVDADFLEEDEVHEFYIMLIDNGNNATSGSANGYNDNKTTVDKTNPSTGDEIFVVVTIMAVTACAAVLLFLNKKRIFK